MKSITIKSKCYYAITTVIDGATFKIPPKGKDVTVTVTKVNELLEQLVKDKKIQIIENN
jgi:hypothetical protein